jgi:hypothetical protein
MRHGIALLLLTAGTALAEHQVQLTWEGTVDTVTTLRVQGDRVDVDSRDTRIQPTFRFNEPLPSVNQTVRMTVRGGSGRVTILEQPRPANDYTLVVRINPRNRGRDVYSLAFEWEGANTAYDRRAGVGRRSRTNENLGRRQELGDVGSVTWSGTVDDEVFVTFANRRAFTTAVRGRNVSDQQANFSGALPRSEVVTRIENVEGRGRVEIMEQPSRANGFRAKVRVVDSASGSSFHRFSLSWDRDGYGQQSSSGSVLSPYPTEGAVLTPGDSNFGFNGMRWSGRVDGHIRVTVDNGRVTSQRISGGPISNERAAFSGQQLGRYATDDVSIRKLQGREDVTLVERPTSANGYRLVFEIDDDDGGADDYEVEIRW